MYTIWYKYFWGSDWCQCASDGLNAADSPNSAQTEFVSIDEAQKRCYAINPNYEIGWRICQNNIVLWEKYTNSEWVWNKIADPEPEYIDDPNVEKKDMIKAKITREAGKLVLVIDAKEFHDTLDTIGVLHDGSKYLNGPATTEVVADVRNHTMSTSCLLKREYPAKFDLSGLWTAPPRFDHLKAICDSAYTQARKILDHYQPIDICIEIQKKVVK